MESGGPSAPVARLVAAVFVMITAFWLLLLAYSIDAALPFNPFTLALAQKVRIQAFVPQGWKFFTKNPRDERIDVLAKDDNGRWRSILLGHNASAANLFGIRRNSRAQGVEFGLIASSLGKNRWISCSQRVDVCMNAAPVAATVKNISPGPTLCGEVVLVKQPPVPWAWSRSKREVVMPSKCAKIRLSCPETL